MSIEPTIAGLTTSIGYLLGGIIDLSTPEVIGKTTGLSFEIIIPIAGVIFWLGRWMSKMDGEIKSIKEHLSNQDDTMRELKEKIEEERRKYLE